LTRSDDIIRMEIMEVLREVEIPEKKASVYDLELIKDVEIEEDRVRLVFHPDAMLCSSMQVAFSIRASVKTVSGPRKVEIHVADYQRVCLTKRD